MYTDANGDYLKIENARINWGYMRVVFLILIFIVVFLIIFIYICKKIYVKIKL